MEEDRMTYSPHLSPVPHWQVQCRSAINLLSSTRRLFISDSDMSLVCNCHDGETEKLRIRGVGEENRGLKRSRCGLTLGRENLQAAEDILVKVAISANLFSM